MYVKAEKELPELYQAIIADELNVKEVVFTDDTDAFTGYHLKPQLKTLGPKYGKLVPKIGKYLAECDGSAAVKGFKNGKNLVFTIDDTEISLAESDVLIETTEKAGFITEADLRMSVVLDTNLTPELVEEGFVREIVSKVQTMRKEAGFEVTDRIVLSMKGNDEVEAVAKRNEAGICADVLADGINYGTTAGYEKEWNLNGHAVTFAVERKA